MAPEEKGTFGLLVLLITDPLPPNEVINEPEKNRLVEEELVVMERTSAAAPERPPKGGADQELAFVSQTATAFPGEVKVPPTHTLLCVESQNIDLTSPFGPFEPRGENASESVEYAATLVADVPLILEKSPAK